MAEKHKILILDDEQDLLDLYRDLLSKLPSQPEVFTANSGARALALLNAERFSMLLTDLNMPGMDGFQVITIVRRRFPALRTVVMTSLADEQIRARAYAMGIDLYLEKPNEKTDVQLFIDCIESLLEREDAGGFRGVQSKSLVDLIQLECLSQSSSVLKITNKSVEARIWIQDGDVIDAQMNDLTGESAFKSIMSWKTGNFEMLAADPKRTRTIFGSYQGLLLDTAQAIDESQATEVSIQGEPSVAEGGTASPLGAISRVPGVEFAVAVDINDKAKVDSWGIENPAAMAAWVHDMMHKLHVIGEKVKAGHLLKVEGMGVQSNLGFLSRPDKELCVGLRRNLSQGEMASTLSEVGTKWVS
ncbi:MAG TPA: response regulator [Verrucomicrobiae bacterium]